MAMKTYKKRTFWSLTTYANRKAKEGLVENGSGKATESGSGKDNKFSNIIQKVMEIIECKRQHKLRYREDEMRHATTQTPKVTGDISMNT